MADKKKLGDIFIDKGIIGQTQVEAALASQKQWGGKFGSHLVKLGFISEVILLKFLCSQHDCPGADLSKITLKKDVLSLIPKNIAKKNFVLPLDIREVNGKRILYTAMPEPCDVETRSELSLLAGIEIKPVLATESQILSAIEKYYDGKPRLPIEPLSGDMFDVKTGAIIDEFPQKKKAASPGNVNIARDQNPEILALVNILIKKGIFKWEEYISELLKVKE